MQMSKENKTRVYQIAKKLGLKSTKLLSIMSEIGIKGKGNLSAIDSDTASLIEEYVSEMRKKQKGDEKKLQRLKGGITLHEFASRFNISVRSVREQVMKLGLPYKLDRKFSRDEIHYLASEMGLDVPEFTNEEFARRFKERAPVVTVMGHVDHGKTTLLDAIRKTSIAEREKGKITQAIGASVVRFDNKDIIFIDTPGHEAFTEMRLRGSIVTDIVILVVAADEGVKEQTIESIDHARAANVPIIVAINKIDRPNADPERVKQQLADRGLLPEDWGGSTIYVAVSAKTGKGIKELLEMVILQAELLELKTDYNILCSGTVIESKMDKNSGPLAAIIVQTGTLKVGDFLRAGNVVGKVRFITNTDGKRMKEAKAVSALEIAGLPDVPKAGEIFYVIGNGAEAKKEVKHIELLKASKKSTIYQEPKTIEDLFKEMQEKEIKKLLIILKTGTQGSFEAVKHAINEIKSPIPMEIIHEGIGGIVKSDILLADAANAVIIGFGVRPTSEAKKEAKERGTTIKTYDVIFELTDALEALLKGMVIVEKKEVVIGKAIVKKVFKVSGVGTIAGCLVTEGKVVRGMKAKVLRNNVVKYSTEISSLKRFKQDTKEVPKNYECGIGLKNFNDLKVNDEIEVINKEDTK